MNFASYDFWKFLAICFLASRLLVWAVRRSWPAVEATTAKVCLFGTALTLLASESWLTLCVFLWIVIIGWICVFLQTARLYHYCKQSIFFVLLLAQLAPLFYYKYWNFVLNECFGLDVRIPSVLIPMGLSFYTFQTVGFWIDNIRKPQPRPKFLDYLNFSSFFPQIVAGPIEKRESLLPQIEKSLFRIDRSNIETALQWIVLGLAYKLIVADNIAALSEKFDIDPENAWQVWFECFAFGIRIYFDFAGYSFMAIGLGALLGVKLTLNFRSPYWTQDLQQFWRDWHVTLGAWLRDYVYLPLGGGRVSWRLINILIVFLVSGVWHGAGWGFLIWGLLHGIGVALAKPWRKYLPTPALRWGVMIFYVTFAWLFFLERDPSLMFQKAASLLSPASYLGGTASDFTGLFSSTTQLATTAFIVMIAMVALAVEGLGLLRSTDPYRMLRHSSVTVALVLLIVLLAPLEDSSFIYFNF